LSALIEAVPAAAIDYKPESWDGIPSEKLTIRQQVCHLRDIEIDGYHVRFRRVLEEECPQLASIDTDALTAARAYDRTDMDAAFAAFAAARHKTLDLLCDLSPANLRRRGFFDGYGSVTFGSLIFYLSSHDQQHLSGIEWLLGRHAGQDV
jgi:hypothetical protein